ncbi:MAG: protein translocase subunit SecD [Actinomycetes bacterium]
MATPGRARPGRYLALTAVLIVGLYAAMFGSSHKSPQLGLDLRGGTQVTLTPKAVQNAHQKISKSNLAKSVDILRQRVNGIGVAESDVTTEGSNVVVSVPGKGRDQVLQIVGQTALLRIRQALQEAAVSVPPPTGTPSPGATATPKASTSGAAKPKPSSSTHGRALTGDLLAAPPPAPTPAPPPAATPAVTPSPGASPSTAARQAVELKTLSDAQAFFATFNCDPAQKPADLPGDYLVACDTAGTTKFLLAPAAVEGTEIKGASAGLPQNSLGGNDWQVNLSFKSSGSNQFAKLTGKIVKLPQPPSCSPPTGCNAAAIVLDGVVESAPFIDPQNSPNGILGGQAEINGNFSQKTANDLANVLKYGALPIQFQVQQAVTVSPTLGSDQLHAGLLAGAIGLIAVVIYSFLYYRGLGVVTVASLAVAGLLTYAAVSLLAATISYTLTLAGIAGLIVAIGITADSFIVYFERLRDEVREGRTLRSAVERGWTRAVRTILAADFVSLLAAVVLYLLSIGSVRGFAFTLGLSTLIDLLVVFIFTKPLVTVLINGKLFGSGRPWTGLSPERLGVTTVRADLEPPRRRVPRVGEA